jgi:hypothetical protein
VSPVNRTEPAVLQSTLFVAIVNVVGFAGAQTPWVLVQFFSYVAYSLSLAILVSSYWRMRKERSKTEVNE